MPDNSVSCLISQSSRISDMYRVRAPATTLTAIK